MRSYQGGTPAQRWENFNSEYISTRANQPAKIPQEKIEQIKKLLQAINPKTGFPWGVKEVALETNTGRYTVSRIDRQLRRDEWRKKNEKLNER